jgi:hypothetical protein
VKERNLYNIRKKKKRTLLLYHNERIGIMQERASVGVESKKKKKEEKSKECG